MELHRLSMGSANATRREVWARRVYVACAVSWVLAPSIAWADHLFNPENHPMGTTRETPLTISDYAEGMLRWADLVAWGMFISPCEGALLGERDVETVSFDTWPPAGVTVNEDWLRWKDDAGNPLILPVEFRIDERFKGNVDGILRLKAPNHILVYPGFTITRYEMRRRLFAVLRQEMASVQARLDEIEPLNLPGLPAIPTASEPMDPEVAILRQQRMELARAHGVVPGIKLRTNHGKLLWEVGGAVRCGQSYLVALDPDEQGAYSLSFSFDGTLWWGDEAEQIVSLLRKGIEVTPQSRPEAFDHSLRPCYVCSD